MFNQKLVACIKVAGKVLKEQKDQVFLPFGSEYSIFLKNLNSVRAAVRIQLDGQDVTDGKDLIVQPNSSIDLERFIKNGNLTTGNKFKFIERTGKIEAHRGIGGEDGLLRVEFQFEKVTPKPVVVETIHKHTHYYDYYRPWYWYPNQYYLGGPYYGSCHGFANSVDNSLGGGLNNIGSASLQSDPTSYSADVTYTDGNGGVGQYTQTIGGTVPVGNAGVGATSVNYCSASVGGDNLLRSKSVGVSHLMPTMDSFVPEVNDAGITVAGSFSNQTFTVVGSFPLEDEKHVIVLKLLGKAADKVVKEAVTVKTAQTCPTCGTRNRGKTASFCRDCGTALTIV